MSVHKKSREEIKLMRYAGNVVALVHQEMARIIEPGVSTAYLDAAAARIIKENNCIPTFLGYNGFPATICASVNSQVVHGIPSDDCILKEGDIISINIPENRLDVKVSEEEMQKRREKWQPRQPRVTTGYLARYEKMVTSANRGAVLEIK